MANPDFKNLKDTYKRREVLLPSIERHVLRKAQEPSDRRSDIMHPSEMAKSSWCARHDFYRIKGVPADYKGRAPSFKLENVFDYGHSVHAKYQRWLQEMGILYGIWKCKDCNSEWEHGVLPACPVCGTMNYRYKEVPLADEDLMIAGHSDGIVFIDGKYMMIEIKTIGISTLRFESYSLFERYQNEQLTPEELWFQIKRPFATHIRQGQMYLYLAKTAYPELGIDEIIFIYEWKPTQEVKEFVVKYNPDIVAQTILLASAVSACVRSGYEVERPPWAVQEGKVCSSCEYRKTCWGSTSTESEESKPALRVRRSTTDKRRRALRS